MIDLAYERGEDGVWRSGGKLVDHLVIIGPPPGSWTTFSFWLDSHWHRAVATDPAKAEVARLDFVDGVPLLPDEETPLARLVAWLGWASTE